ncbi:hypothetical protein C2R22_20365 [Salinigranum rubrum]|uniref:Uncharacterized protein n=1 Tax=Salinigranum rubrum TaxID=755307 RepID=A0A2I8VRA0_9EURY|nr:hypothetical protein [Salinigranum rubrum]AUV83709.1 hypothetical protein C2R22_20365 [Salinigranum rubrum]
MPPSLPTGTVSQTSAGTRTFPPESNSDSDRERVSAASTPYRRSPRTQQPPTPDQPPGPPSPVIPRREYDAAVAREHDRVAELARENEALREYIREQATDRQAVIERYEHLLQQRDAHEASRPAPAPASDRPSPSLSTDSPPPTEEGLFDAVRTGLTSLRSRVAGWLGR